MVQLVQWLTCNTIFFFFLIRRLHLEVGLSPGKENSWSCCPGAFRRYPSSQSFQSSILLTNRLPWILPSIISLRTTYFFFYRIEECQWFFHSGMNFSIYYSLYPKYFYKHSFFPKFRSGDHASQTFNGENVALHHPNSKM